jgi:hypothetical protein
MSIILRIDVDRPYGRSGIVRHLASRISTDYYLPRIPWLRYLGELGDILGILNEREISAYVCFRKCSLPSENIIKLMAAGRHAFSLHLENSRTYETFKEELDFLQTFLHVRVETFSKHGSGIYKYGRNHYAPYEPEKYVEWAMKSGMKCFWGNLEDPTIRSIQNGSLIYFPSAFWLESSWRDVEKYPITWLVNEARERDIVMLLHPDNVVSDPKIMRELLFVLERAAFRLI